MNNERTILQPQDNPRRKGTEYSTCYCQNIGCLPAMLIESSGKDDGILGFSIVKK